MTTCLINKIGKEYEDYLKDESRKVGSADSISFPKNESEIIDILLNLNKEKIPVTIQGARTGISSGAVPKSGHILNLSKMNKITGLRYEKETETFYLKVQPGVLLTQIREALKNKNFNTENWTNDSLSSLELFEKSGNYSFMPDPTETTASIGGMTSCNASGACSFKYGATRNYIESLRIVLINGDVISLKRGEAKAFGRNFSIKTLAGHALKGNIPSYSMPKVKNASGYFAKDDMDLIDIFIGNDGTLGIITELELKLIKTPSSIYGLVAFFDSEKKALKFVSEIREKSSPAAIEFFNYKVLNLLRHEKETNPCFSKLLKLPTKFHTAVYMEYHGKNDEEVEDLVFEASTIIEDCGGNADDTWLAADSRTEEQLHIFRHAAPEAVNLIIDERRRTNPSITKLGTDMAVPDSKLEEVMNLYNSTLNEENLDYVIFGHIGNNHLHVNILPRNIDDFNKGKELYNKWADKIIKMGGTVSAEHGIGKLKANLLTKMFKEKGITEMKALKQVFDPENRLNVGNLFDK